jgi:hypothetical protein
MLSADSLAQRMRPFRLRLRICLVALALGWPGTISCRAADNLTITRASKKALDVSAEVRAFVEGLLAKNAKVKSQFEQLSAETRAEAGGRFSVGKMHVIEWLTPSYENDFRDGVGTRDIKQVFLIQQPLVAGYHHGYAVTENVTSLVRVFIHSDFREDKKSTEGFILTEQKLTMKFQGFVKVTLTPVP